MIKDLFLAPGRLFCQTFLAANKNRPRFTTRQVVKGPVLALSLICWLLVALAAYAGVMKFASPVAPSLVQTGTDSERTPAAAQAGSSGQGTGGAAQAGAAGAGARAGASGQASGSVPAGAPSQAAGTVPGTPGAQGQAPGQSAPAQAAAAAVPEAGEAWLVIVESVPKQRRTEAEQSVARHKRRGVDLELFDTDAYPFLKSGMWALASGPYENKNDAEAAAAVLKPKVRDLMVRRGL
ncbi:MAG: hypothetical protein LBO05_10000 [Deltaproteobacteria bacterium]|jgi:hypothetical protein|nr:hypothetical protein [Deltaproteobacteria bacterium]